MRYSCVIISILETQTILTANVSAESGIFGVNFYVHVNGSALVCYFFYSLNFLVNCILY